MIRRAISVAVYGVIIYLAGKFLLNLDFDRVINNHAPGPCEIVKGIDYGSEDFTILSNGVALISSGVKLPKLIQDVKDYKGRIFIFDINANATMREAKELKIVGTLDRTTFYPVGISSWENKATGQITVFVINSGPEPNTVEIFHLNYKQLELQYLRTVSSPLISGANNLMAISENSFYLTNFYYFSNNLLRILEFFLPLNLGSIVFCTGNSVSLVADGLSGPNGINMSPDKKYLYVSNLLRREFLVFAAKVDHTLDLKERYPLYTLVDNIEVEPQNGAVWIAGHPILYQLIRGTVAPLERAIPSQVLRLEMKDGKVSSVTEMYSNDGSQLSGASVASLYKNKLLIGSVWHKLLICDVKIPL